MPTSASVKKLRIYFAHPYSTWKLDMEQNIIAELEKRGYEVINPFDREQGIMEAAGVERYYDDPSLELAKSIVQSDIGAIDLCDGIFAWYPPNTAMIGTTFEVALVHCYNADIRTDLVISSGALKQIMICCETKHPFLWVFADTFYLGIENFFKDINLKEITAKDQHVDPI